MSTSYTKESKPVTSFTKETKPGAGGFSYYTWDSTSDTWDTATYTWDTAGSGVAATSYTKESKPATSFTKETKP